MSKPRVYVVEAMCIRQCCDSLDTCEITSGSLALGKHTLPCDLDVQDSRQYEQHDSDGRSRTTFLTTEYVVVLTTSEQALPQELQGEYYYARVPGCGEVFEGDRKLLILNANDVEELSGEFAIDVLGNLHQKEIGDPELVLFDAAFDRLMIEMGREYEGSPHYEKLPDAISEVLRGRNLTRLSCDDISALSSEVHQHLTAMQATSL